MTDRQRVSEVTNIHGLSSTSSLGNDDASPRHVPAASPSPYSTLLLSHCTWDIFRLWCPVHSTWVKSLNWKSDQHSLVCLSCVCRDLCLLPWKTGWADYIIFYSCLKLLSWFSTNLKVPPKHRGLSRSSWGPFVCKPLVSSLLRLPSSLLSRDPILSNLTCKILWLDWRKCCWRAAQTC